MAEAAFSDEELTSYLDGEASSALRQRIEQAVAKDPALEARLAQLEAPIALLNRGLDALPSGEPPEVVSNLALAPKLAAQGSGGWRLAACLVAGLVIGALATPFGGDASSGWREAIASYQALYVPETLAGAAQDRSMSERLLAAYGDEQSVSLSGVIDIEGVTFKRAQMLGLRGEPLLQIAYVASDGAPIALCVTPVSDPDQAPRIATYGGLTGVDWVQDGQGYLLIGNAQEEVLLRLVDELRRL